MTILACVFCWCVQKSFSVLCAATTEKTSYKDTLFPLLSIYFPAWILKLSERGKRHTCVTQAKRSAHNIESENCEHGKKTWILPTKFSLAIVSVLLLFADKKENSGKYSRTCREWAKHMKISVLRKYCFSCVFRWSSKKNEARKEKRKFLFNLK